MKTALPAKRKLIAADPYRQAQFKAMRGEWDWQKRGLWPCSWVSPPGLASAGVWAYRLKFSLAKAAEITAHVSGDERYELYLDGERVGRGSERGDLKHWFYESYALKLGKGRHCLVAKCWSQGSMAPFAQASLRPGFLFATEGEFAERLGTGRAPWQVKSLPGIRFTENHLGWGTGANVEIDAKAYPWGVEKGGGSGWVKALSRPGDEGCDGASRNENPPTRRLWPATLPAMFESRRGLPQFPKSFAARTSSELLIDLDDYVCAYPELCLSGGKGAKVEILWAESLFTDKEFRQKGNRNETKGKFFLGMGDSFLADGGKGRRFSTLWWQAGRYILLKVSAGAEALTIDSLSIRECRYPLESQAEFTSSDPRLGRFFPIGLRGLQMCSHETFMDCPYYEQLMYVGDTRLECLVTHVLTQDSRLAAKPLTLFNASRLENSLGLTQSRYPSRIHQVIPPFSLWWVALVHDHALWRGGRKLIEGVMPGVRGVIDAFRAFMNPDGLVEAPEGWNYMDWVPGWPAGVPPRGEFGVSPMINWQFVYALECASRLEVWMGEPELAARQRKLASALAARLVKRFWDPKRRLFKDGPGYTEHSQCLALLSGHLPAAVAKALAQSLPEAEGLERTTIYFSHYLFEAYAQLGRMDKLFERLELWFQHEARGLKTPMEAPEPTRSDCHAWGSHPLYHYFATILGIRPSSFGFESVAIRPQLGPLSSAKGKMPHPKGFIEVDLELRKGKLSGSVTLPKGLRGELWIGRLRKALKPGRQKI